MTDGTPGLQLDKKGEWVSVRQLPNVYIVNIGDMLERWSNGLYKSTVHRVVLNAEVDRYSVPFFFEPNYLCTVSCLPTCCSEGM